MDKFEINEYQRNLLHQEILKSIKNYIKALPEYENLKNKWLNFNINIAISEEMVVGKNTSLTIMPNPNYKGEK